MTTSATEKPMFDKVLIANRGEIAVRIIRALRCRGIRSAVVYSDADRSSLAVRLADEAYRIGPAPAAESYLLGDRLVELAVEIGARAIHPGYGFLSENADFARACEQRGVVFIGPSAAAITAMGSKIESRRLMIDAGVPVVPGGRDPLSDLAAAQRAALEIGYPVMIKAAAGGGGKGMRLVADEGQLAAAFRAARSEALSSFGDDDVYLEKFLIDPRHVEIQILGDSHGRVVSLGERECSLQRRHQKVVEEAPSPVVEPPLRERMGSAAVQAAQAVAYVGAGTVEFLLDSSGNFYFLEMNTRIQVEHPVTELVTGLDLVAAQLDIAAGKPLAANHPEVMPIQGHAIEVRIYAEDPFRGFIPSPGRIRRLRWPHGPGIRVDEGVAEGDEISIFYDPMIAKLIAWGNDRKTAITRLEGALAEMRIDGIATTVPFFLEILRDADFRAGHLDIGMLDRRMADGSWLPSSRDDDDRALIAAAIAYCEIRQRRSAVPTSGDQHSPPRPRSQWHRLARHESLRRSQWS